MGMSAGQARLLSITARLSDNELRSQSITNAKLRLATESTDASKAYMEALNSTQLMYRFYDDTGALSYQSLTANTLLSYHDLKNQYSIVNSAGQILVSGTDVKKYEEASNLTEYLYSYGIGKGTNPAYIEALKDIYGTTTNDNGDYLYETLYDEEDKYEWDRFCNSLIEGDSDNNGIPDLEYLQSILQKSNEDLSSADADEFTKIVSNWRGIVDGTELSGIWEGMGGTFGAYMDGLLNLPNVEFPDKNDFIVTEDSLAEDFSLASKACFENAMGDDYMDSDDSYDDSGSPGCYLHVLAHLLDLKSSDLVDKGNGDYGVFTYGPDGEWGGTYTTTAGGYTIVLNSVYINGSAICGSGQTKDMVPISEYLCADNDGDGAADVLAPATGDTITADSTDLEKLLSNYKINSSGEMVQKTFKEKVIDLFYVVENRTTLGVDYKDLKSYLENFQTDMTTTLSGISEDYDKAVNSWRDTMQKWIDDISSLRISYTQSIDAIPPKEAPDKTDPKYQWYLNLWYRMGASGEKKQEDDPKNYKELDANLLNNSEWLEFALEHGIVTLEQATFVEDGSEKYPEIGTYDWVSIIYTNAADLTSQEDEQAIALAEVKYKNAMTEIENKDKKYDQDLKKLDTEHNALQTEYESIKNTIDKNVERSFKAFS